MNYLLVVHDKLPYSRIDRSSLVSIQTCNSLEGLEMLYRNYRAMYNLNQVDIKCYQQVLVLQGAGGES